MFAFVNDWLGPAKAPATPTTPWGRSGGSLALEAVSCAFSSNARSATTGRARPPALERISLEIAAGELVCLVGPSGSGKSTILNLIAGLLRPTEGRVLSGGEAVRGPAPDRAVVFQEAALFPWLTLRQNVEFPLRVQGKGARERAERSERLLRRVHLWRFSGSYPHELSGGMRQRGALARALATDPAVLLMDEPFAALDAETREILQGELERIWASTKKTIVFVTHNVREAVRLGDRVVLMATRPGRIVADIPIDLPRPRATNDERVSALSKDIARLIANEVAKVAEEEADDAWVAPGSPVREWARPLVGRRV